MCSNTLNPVQYWIGLSCSVTGTYSWYDGTPYSYNYFISPTPTCIGQSVYGDGSKGTQWNVGSSSSKYSALCYKCTILLVTTAY